MSEPTPKCQWCAHNEQLLLRAKAHNEVTYQLYVTYYNQCQAQEKGIRRLRRLITRLRSTLSAQRLVIAKLPDTIRKSTWQNPKLRESAAVLVTIILDELQRDVGSGE